MRTIIECVPNVSEGRDRAAIEQMAASVRGVAGVRLLDVSSDPSHNRSVLTFVGDAAAVARGRAGALRGGRSRIDLRKHRGEHPRMGAVDVVPFIPIRGSSVDECVALSGRSARRSPRASAIPVYLYEESASAEPRRNLAEIRKGQFEGFAEKMKDPIGGSPTSVRPCRTRRRARWPWAPARISSPTTSTWATRDLAVADRIAKAIRHLSGGFRYVKAMGVELADRGIVQVSINMTNFKKTPLHRVFECVRSEADRHGVPIVGSEIVGLTPAEALYMAAAEHYLRLEGFSAEQVLETKLLEE